jgi:hypothetical protein
VTEAIYRFTDEHGDHEHVNYTGPYDFKRPITCKACLDALEAQRVDLCEKYGWKQWPFPKE